MWGAVISGAAAVGPLADGALTEWVSWYSRLSRVRPRLVGAQSSFSFFGWTWFENAAISPVPLGLAISAVGFALFIRSEEHRERGHRSALLYLELFFLFHVLVGQYHRWCGSNRRVCHHLRVAAVPD